MKYEVHENWHSVNNNIFTVNDSTTSKDHFQLSIPLDLLFYRMFKYINDSLLFNSFVTFRHSINDMKIETCILFAPNKNKRSCCSFNPTLFMAGGQFSSTYILVLYLCMQILVAY